MPIKKRSAKNAANVVVSADSPLPIENNNNVTMKTFFRPIRSASSPNTSAPTAMPIELTLPIQPTWLAVKFQSFCKAAIKNDNMPTSIASNSQPRPAMPNSLRWEIAVWFMCILLSLSM
ncbi:hypothetical protein I656_00733 [Geobacillus sp. WSUCF1]|nr:hypothetical protein I656_00733 [Geobacillus sp. WSUCF1]